MLYGRILTIVNPTMWPTADMRVRRFKCKCKAKQGLVPAHRINDWGRALHGTPLAPAVTPSLKCLGIRLGSLALNHEISKDPAPCPTNVAILATQISSWEHPIVVCQTRVADIMVAYVTVGNRVAS